MRRGLAALALACPLAAGAATGWAPLALLHYEHGSSDFDEPPSSFDQDLLRVTAGIIGEYATGQQRLYADLRAGAVNYDEFTDLGSENEYSVMGGAEFGVGKRFGGGFEASSDERVSSINEIIIGTAIDGEDRLTGRLRWQPLQLWRIEGWAMSRDLDTPVVGDTGFGLRETIHAAEILFEARDWVTLGAGYEEIDGRFRGDDSGADYTQETPAGIVEWRPDDRTVVQARLGRTERVQTGLPEPFEETTGSATLTRLFGSKTTLTLQYRRGFENYYGIDAGAFGLADRIDASIAWEATAKTRLILDYGHADTDFLGQATTGPAIPGRDDRYVSTAFTVEWKALRWLKAELSFELDDLDSNIERFDYRGTVIGLTLEARWHDDWQDEIGRDQGTPSARRPRAASRTQPGSRSPAP